VPSDDHLPEGEELPWGHACAVAAVPGREPEASLLPDSAVAAEEEGLDPGGRSKGVDDADNSEAEVRTYDAGTEDTSRRAEVPCSGRAGDRIPGVDILRSLSGEAGDIQEGPLHEQDGGNIEEVPVVDSNGDENAAGLEVLGVL
jgi:hypothetical protein